MAGAAFEQTVAKDAVAFKERVSVFRKWQRDQNSTWASYRRESLHGDARSRLAARCFLLDHHRLALLIMASRAEPLSIESLLQKQKEEKEAAAKVRMSLSKYAGGI